MTPRVSRGLSSCPRTAAPNQQPVGNVRWLRALLACHHDVQGNQDNGDRGPRAEFAHATWGILLWSVGTPRQGGQPAASARLRDYNRGKATTTIVISILYLLGTTANVQHQHAAARGVCARQTEASVMTSAVRWWLLPIASSQVESCAEPDTRFSRTNRGRSPPRTPADLRDG